MYHNQLFQLIRRFLRMTGTLPIVVRVWRRVTRSDYERSFNMFILENICENDIFWDVGANDGHYIDEIKSHAFFRGRLVAFEPSPTSFKRLSERFYKFADVTIINKALSDEVGHLDFYFDPNFETSVEDSLAYHPGKDVCNVELITAEEFVLSNTQLFPNCIKIDVEGFEKKVVKGLGVLLDDRRLRCLFIEMHFLKMDMLGEREGSRYIFDTLKNKGFKLTWTDPSHLCAVRN